MTELRRKNIRHVVSMEEFSAVELVALVDLAIDIKNRPRAYAHVCAGEGLVILMEKTSTRTTLSFAAGMAQLGGWFLTLDWRQSNFSISPARHEVRYMSRNCSVMMARVRSHETLAELTEYASVPVINGCDDRFHPSQALADLITMREVAGKLKGLTLAYVGILNNIANSLLAVCPPLGIRLRLVTPMRNEAARDEALIGRAQASGLVECHDSIATATDGADFVYTDTWIDMEWFNDESYAAERRRRIAEMGPFQLNVHSLEGSTARIMHDMPLHPGYEIAEELVDDPRSVIFQQAENRLYSAKALLATVLGRSAG